MASTSGKVSKRKSQQMAGMYACTGAYISGAARHFNIGHLPRGNDGSRVKPEKICPVCQTPHTHNNSYCSAECCKRDRL